MARNYYIWIEIQANKEKILNEKSFEEVLDNCQRAGFESIILGVKDTAGFGIYQSEIVPHYSKLEAIFEKNKDYLSRYIKAVHQRGLKIYAAIDVFSEGRINQRTKLSPGFYNKEWQTKIYGLDDKGQTQMKSVIDVKGLRTVSAIDDFDDVFVNPVREDVQQYELDVIEELITNYDLDGFCLDRVRFIGLGADFSDYTRKKFESYIGTVVAYWPEDIYSLKDSSDGFEDTNNELKVKYGSLFGKWLTFRADIIKSFIVKVKNLVERVNKDIEFLDYTGSWYPIYYQVGANWASREYQVEEYPWVDKEYKQTGYAEHIDKLLSGFYYPEVTMEEAEAKNKPAYWYSVEGAGKIADQVVNNVAPIIGSLFVPQYNKYPEKFKEAINKCFEVSSGCMIFDLSYIDNYNWWSVCKINEDR